MKRVLVCDDHELTIRGIALGVSMQLADQVELVTTTDLDGLVDTAASGIRFDAVFLDGHLEEGTTLPFLERLAEGAFPHLADARFVLMSTDEELLLRMAAYLADHFRYSISEKKEVVAEIRKLATS